MVVNFGSIRGKVTDLPVTLENYHPDIIIGTRVFFTHKSARFYAFRYKSTLQLLCMPFMLAPTKICKRTRSDYRLFSLWFTVPLAFFSLHSLYGIVFCVSSSVPFKALWRTIGSSPWKIGSTDFLTMCKKDAFFLVNQPIFSKNWKFWLSDPLK